MYKSVFTKINIQKIRFTKSSSYKCFFQSGFVIVSFIPEIILCLIQNKKMISTFLSTFGIIKQVLSSYEVNIKCVYRKFVEGWENLLKAVVMNEFYL
jgi:citrate lyase synthetase